MPSITTRFPPPLHERFIAECERREISPSDFIRKAVEAMMDHIDTPGPAMERPRLVTPSVIEAVAKAEAIAHAMGRLSPMRGVRGFAVDGSGPLPIAGPRPKK